MKSSMLQSALSHIARSWDSLLSLDSMQQTPEKQAQEMAPYSTAHSMRAVRAGVLHSMPAGWLHLLIKHLSAKERLVLFAVNRQLSRQVVASSPHVVLELTGLNQRTTERRCRTINNLLTNRSSLEVELHVGWEPQPFPVMLSDRITALTVEKSRWANQTLSDILSWPNMQHLQKLKIQGVISAMDITELCGALDSGHLQQLHSLSWDVREWSTPFSADLLANLFSTHFTQLTVGNMTFTPKQFKCSTVPQSLVLHNYDKADHAAKQADADMYAHVLQDRYTC